MYVLVHKYSINVTIRTDIRIYPREHHGESVDAWVQGSKLRTVNGALREMTFVKGQQK